MGREGVAMTGRELALHAALLVQIPLVWMLSEVLL